MYDEPIPTIRTLGFRKRKEHQTPPIIHAKLVLLGHLWWHDEDDSPAGVADVTGFEPYRLWICRPTSRVHHGVAWSSATGRRTVGSWRVPNASSSSSCALQKRSTRASDHFEPELVPAEYDDAAMAEAWAEMRLTERPTRTRTTTDDRSL